MHLFYKCTVDYTYDPLILWSLFSVFSAGLCPTPSFGLEASWSRREEIPSISMAEVRLFAFLVLIHEEEKGLPAVCDLHFIIHSQCLTRVARLSKAESVNVMVERRMRTCTIYLSLGFTFIDSLTESVYQCRLL